MVICPKCKTQYPDGTEFCEIDGARLVPADSTESARPPASAGSERPATAAADLDDPKKLRAELKKREQRIAELEKELEAARREPHQVHGTAAPSESGSSGESGSSLEDTAPVPSPRPFLVWVGGSRAGERFEITAKGLEIGRNKKYAAAGGISINDTRVSNPHAWVGIEGDSVIVRDKRSTNGTFLNEKKVVKDVRLEPDDTLTIADEEVATFKLEVSG